MGKHIVVLNSVKAAIEMLDKKSSKYSDRPILPMCGELVGCKYGLALLPYGDLFRETRMEVHKFLRRVHERPEQLAMHIRR